MRIIGVDPGLVITGVGVIETGGDRNGPEFRLVYSADIKPPRTELSERLLHLHENLLAVIRKMNCEVMAVEDQFYGNNIQTAFKTGQARGAALLAAAHGGIPVTLYPPARVKQAVVGNGRASKEQVQHMVRQILAVDKFRGGLDSSDALAVALCHAFSLNIPHH
jgi:crossover junction endodeoxyribonuclease RuvC